MSIINPVHLEEGEKFDICDVCELPFGKIVPPITATYGGKELTFCSEKCYKTYLEDPEKYAVFEDDAGLE